jgi:hypothetical protein
VEIDAKFTCYGCADEPSAEPEGGLEVEEEEDEWQLGQAQGLTCAADAVLSSIFAPFWSVDSQYRGLMAQIKG